MAPLPKSFSAQVWNKTKSRFHSVLKYSTHPIRPGRITSTATTVNDSERENTECIKYHKLCENFFYVSVHFTPFFLIIVLCIWIFSACLCFHRQSPCNSSNVRISHNMLLGKRVRTDIVIYFCFEFLSLNDESWCK